ncbi:type IV secretion system DNA-binding domain-containing protein [Catenulispora sp. NL8]|uniref:Type IV secretion system DNA-binding domain-containing protein n=1 Tax=Catenulispora pinistramenti TaxID=2705254 RepID=A0ABS5KGI8_9ACTN|nr:type IV secretion system DNA-binding domain-containing protein [Catenulispora pinistramenti]MBS2545397.1 type IV secretion system DNA-binding domain-containing protein [Catenulispora pinistramenti]
MLDGIGTFFEQWWPLIGAGAAWLACAFVGLRVMLRSRHRRLMADSARKVEILVPPHVEPGSGAAFWAHLHAMLRPAWRRFIDGQPHLVFEYTWTADALTLGVWVPGVVPPGMVERAVTAAWPAAQTTVVTPAPAPIPLTGTATGGRLRLAKPEILPLRSDFDADPLRPLLEAASGLTGRESAAVQVLARPATGRRVRIYRRKLLKLKHEASGASVRVPGRTVVFDAFSPGKPIARAVSRQDPVASAALRAAVGKATGSLWETEIRYAVAVLAPQLRTRTERNAAEPRLRGVAHSVASAFGIHAERNWWRRKPLFRPAPTLASRFWKGGDLLTVAELAAVAHLPMDTAAVGVVRAGARVVAPPARIASSGDPNQLKVLGDADAGPARRVALQVADGRQHTHIMGSTGSGKSTLMARMILDDVLAKRGVVVVDPKGDLIADLLDRLPESAAERTVLIDPTADGLKPSLNILASGEPNLVVDNLVGIFSRIFASSWGPRTDDVFRAACLTLLSVKRDEQPTLADVPALLTDPVVRERYVRALPRDTKNGRVLKVFWKGFNDLPASAQGLTAAPLLNKLRAFLLRDFVSGIVATPESTVDMRKVLNGGICLARLPKGVLGEDAARLLGSFVVAATWQAAATRARSEEGKRIDASLYLDESHNFLNLPYPLEDMLAEARGYRLSLVLAHQNLGQLTGELSEGISANTRNKVFFTCSPEDGRALERHVSPALTEHDLSHLGGYQAAVRLLADGALAPAFTMRTRALAPAVPGRADAIRRRFQADLVARTRTSDGLRDAA